MQTLVIEKFEARYRVPPSASAERERFDFILRGMLGGALEDGLEQADLSPDEEICIREVCALVPVRRSDCDKALARAWSDELVSAILWAAGGARVSGVVRYHSRMEALIDLAAGVALSDSRRSWAWRQLGLWSAGESESNYSSVRELERSLIREAHGIVAVLCALEDVGLLERLASKLSVEQWTALAAAALDAGGANAIVLIDDSVGDYEPESITQACRIVRDARLARWAASTSCNTTSSTSFWRAIAALALLEVDPGAAHLRKDRVASVLAATAALMRPGSLTSIQEAELSGESSGSNESRQNGASLQRDRERMMRSRSSASEHRPDDDCVVGDKSKREASKESAASDRNAPAFDDDCEDERPVPQIRKRAVTRVGGLLLLLGLVEDLGLPDELATNPTLSDRPFRWLMHQLALAIVPVDQHDAAALAFAGLVPESDPPTEGEDSPGVVELAAIRGFAERLVQGLKERVEVEEDVVRHVCWRRAEIVADPGWIEVRFSLDDVRTDIRRAGLDIDPGFIPWLGVTIKFKYE